MSFHLYLTTHINLRMQRPTENGNPPYTGGKTLPGTGKGRTGMTFQARLLGGKVKQHQKLAERIILADYKELKGSMAPFLHRYLPLWTKQQRHELYHEAWVHRAQQLVKEKEEREASSLSIEADTEDNAPPSRKRRKRKTTYSKSKQRRMMND